MHQSREVIRKPTKRNLSSNNQDSSEYFINNGIHMFAIPSLQPSNNHCSLHGCQNLVDSLLRSFNLESLAHFCDYLAISIVLLVSVLFNILRSDERERMLLRCLMRCCWDVCLDCNCVGLFWEDCVVDGSSIVLSKWGPEPAGEKLLLRTPSELIKIIDHVTNGQTTINQGISSQFRRSSISLVDGRQTPQLTHSENNDCSHLSEYCKTNDKVVIVMVLERPLTTLPTAYSHTWNDWGAFYC